MGLPEKDRKDDAKKKSSQEASGEPVSPEILYTEMDAYQRELENDWARAKQAYQNRIDEIVSDFMKENKMDSGAGDESPLPPAPDPEQQTGSQPESPDPNPDRRDFNDMMKDLRDELKKAVPPQKALIFRSSWHAPALRLPNLISGEKVKKAFPWALSLASLALLASFYVWLKTPEKSTDLPYGHAAGLMVEDGSLVIADWYRKDLYFHKPTNGLPIRAVESIPNLFLTGLFRRDGKLVSLNGLDASALVHADSEDHRVIETIPLPVSQASGAWWDGEDLWTADNGEKKIFKIHGGDLREIRDSFSFEEGKVSALQIFENRLWTLDSDTREIRVFRIQDPLKRLATFDLDPFIGTAKPTGFFLKGKTAWLVSEDPARVVRTAVSHLERSRPGDY